MKQLELTNIGGNYKHRHNHFARLLSLCSKMKYYMHIIFMTGYIHNRNAYAGAPENIHIQFYYSVILKMQICSNATDICEHNAIFMFAYAQPCP